MTASSNDASLYPPQPPAAVVQIHDAGPDRLVLDIPPGKHAGGLGCLAIFWNGFMAFFTGIVCTVGFENQPKDQSLWVAYLVIGLFWLIGLGMIYVWLKFRYERCYLLVERDRAVLRRLFLGRQRQTELPLDAGSQAQLTESYRQNEVPVYRVTVTGVGGNTLHFGTSLAQPEKDWCVDAINTLLQPTLNAAPRSSISALAAALICEACGTVIPDDAFRSKDGNVICPGCAHEQAVPVGPREIVEAVTDDIDPTVLPDELPGIVTVLEDSPDRLGLRLRVAESVAARVVVGLFGLGFAVFWYAGVLGGFFQHVREIVNGGQNGVFNWIALVFLIPFLCGGLMPLGLSLLAFGGRLTTWIDREQVRVRLHVGPFGKTWTLPTAEITAVRLIDSSEMPSRLRNSRAAGPNPRVKGSHEISKVAGICAGTRKLSLTALHQPLTARFVVEKVRKWLRDNVPDPKV